MLRIWVSVFCIVLAAAGGVNASEAGRFQIHPGTPTIMVDTATGKSWRYGDAGTWITIPFARNKDAPAAKAHTTSPLRKRWQKETLTRKLSLAKTGKAPAPSVKTTVRQIFAPPEASND